MSVYEEDSPGKAYDGRLMRRMLACLRPYRLAVAAAVFLLMLASGLAVVGPYLTKIALDDAIPNGDGRHLALLALLFAGATLLVFVLQYLQALITAWLGQRVMRDLRTQIFAHLQRLDLAFYDRNPVGRLMTRVTSDVETLNELFSSGLVTVFGDIFTLLFIVVAMLQLDFELALVTFSVLPFVAWTAFVFRSRIRSAFRDIRLRVARMNAFLQERFTGIRVVHLFNREDADMERFRVLNRDYLSAHLRSITYYALFFPIVQLLTAVALALVIWYGGGATIQGTVTIGVLAAFLEYGRRFYRPIQDLSDKYNLLQGAVASSERIFGLLDEEPAIADPAEPLGFPAHAPGEIRFEGVWFAYPSRSEEESHAEEWVIRDLSFAVAPGEKIAIVGHTGAGKTTIVNLLMRFYEPQRGRILVDGVPIGSVRIADLRARVGLVLQDIFLFSRSVAHNVRLGHSEIDDDRVRAALDAVGATPFVERLPGGTGEELGERGARLSVGERQLLSLARALAFDPDILVLDEATSSVDSEVEARIEEATSRLMRGRTSLVVAHRLSTVRSADRIIVMHHGHLAEEGRHDELLGEPGIYRRLHELQFARAQEGTLVHN